MAWLKGNRQFRPERAKGHVGAAWSQSQVLLGPKLHIMVVNSGILAEMLSKNNPSKERRESLWICKGTMTYFPGCGTSVEVSGLQSSLATSHLPQGIFLSEAGLQGCEFSKDTLRSPRQETGAGRGSSQDDPACAVLV